MVTWDDKTSERYAELIRHARGKSNTLGNDGDLISEPFRRVPAVILPETWRQLPSADGGLIPPDHDSYGVQGDISTRFELQRLHPYLSSGTTGPNSVQTFFVVSSTPSGHGTDDIESVRRKNLISPIFSQGKSNAADPDPNVRGFELVLYPAKSSPGGGVGNSLVADEAKPIPPTADPGGGTPIEAAAGLGNLGFWDVDYMGGIVRLSRPPLNGSGGVFNPNDVYGDINGTEVASDAYGTITMFATFYQYTGSLGEVDISTDIIITVGDGYLSTGVYTGNTNNIVQAALNSFTGGGGTVFIKEGDYTFDDSVVVSAGQTVIGLNGRVTVVAPSSDAAFKIDGSDVAIEGLKIRTSGSSTFGSCIELSGDTNGETIENVSVRNNTLYCKNDAYGVEFSPDTFDITYKNVEIRNNIFRNEFNEDQVWNAVGTAGETQTSTGLDGSGMTWMATTAAGTENLNATAHNGKGLWCAVGSAGTIETSHDGEIWVAQTNAGLYGGSFNGVAHDGVGLWCAVGSGGEIQTSPNGENWTAQTADNGYVDSFFAVAHDKAGLWCAVGQDEEIQTSPDGENWTIQTPGGSYNGLFRGVAHNGLGLWCIVGASSEIQTSPDGENWTSETVTPVTVDTLFAVAYSGELWCAVGGSGEIQTSLDGKNWIARTAAGGYVSGFRGVAHDGVGLWCIVGEDPEIQTSPDAGVATAWAARTAAGAFAGDFHAVAFPPAAPIYIGEIYEDGYYSFENLSIVENQFEDPDIGIGTILFNSHAYSLNEILISQNTGKPRLDLTGLDGYMTEIIITNNSFKSVDIGDFGGSIFSDNIVQGNVSFTGTSNSRICDNQIGGQLDPNLYRTILSGNHMFGFVSNSIRESEVTKNIVIGTFGVGADVVSGNIVFASIINENIIEGAVTVGAAMTGTVSGRIFSGSTFSGNALIGACTFGAAGRDQDTPTYENFKMNDNEIPGATIIRGLISDSIISNNTFVGAVTTDNILRTDFNSNNLAGAFVLSVDEANQIVLGQSTISNNAFGSTVSIGDAIETSGTVLDSVISGNTISGAVTVGAAFDNTDAGLIFENSNFSGNILNSTCAFGHANRGEDTATYDNLRMSGNKVSGTTTISGLITGCVISENTFTGAVTTDNILTTGFNSNNLAGAFVLSVDEANQIVLDQSTISNNTFGSTVSIGDAIETSGTVLDSVISDNIMVGAVTVGTAFVTGAYKVFDDSVFSGNILNSTCAFGKTTRDPDTLTYENFKMTNNEISGTTVISGSLQQSVISDNTFTGAVTTDNMLTVGFDNNQLAGAFILSVDETNQIVLDQSVISNNIFGSSVGIGDGVTDTGTVLDSVISGNIMVGAVTIGTSMTGTTPGYVMDGSMFNNNKCMSAVALGHANRGVESTFVDSIINDNIMESTLTISGNFDGYSISNNVIESTFAVDGLYDTIVVENRVAGNVSFGTWAGSQTAVANCNVSNNIFENVLRFGPSITSGAAIENCTICENRADYIHIGASMTQDTVVNDSMIDGNIATNAVTIGAAMTGTTAGLIFNYSSFSNNILQSTCAFGNAGRDQDTSTYVNFRMSGNEIAGTLNITGLLQESVISNNTLTGAVTTDNMLTTNFSNNYLDSTFYLSDDTNAIVLDQSIISNNHFGDTVDIGAGIDISGTVLGSVISGNVMIGAVTVAAAFDSTDAGNVLEDTVFSDNVLNSTCGFGNAGRSQITTTYVNSVINGNRIAGALTISGTMVSTTINNNALASITVDQISRCVISTNHVNGGLNITIASDDFVIHGCIISNNSFGGTCTFDHSTAGSIANPLMSRTVFSNNVSTTTVTFGSLTDDYDATFTDSVISGNALGGGLSLLMHEYTNLDGLIITGNSIAGTITIDAHNAGNITIPSTNTAIDIIMAFNWARTWAITIDFTGDCSINWTNAIASEGAPTASGGANRLP